MRVALVNPAWDFAGSTYFGCRAPHLPLELGYAAAALRAGGHETLMVDAALDGLDQPEAAARVRDWQPAMTVVTTAPTYLFWRCAQPELTVPHDFLARLGEASGITVAVGPHGSATPDAVLRKLGVSAVIQGECDAAILALADAGGAPAEVAGAAWLDGDAMHCNGGPQSCAFVDAPALRWPDAWISRHRHHHHRFDTDEDAPGAEVEASRGCPYACSFCAKIDFRDRYRRRRLDLLTDEIDGLIAQGARYLYFIDEIFLPSAPLLEALARRDVRFGVQTRIDLWKPDMLDRLGAAGCVSIEAGVESLTEEGRAALDKDCRVDTDTLTARLLHARSSVPFVQANLIHAPGEDMGAVARWRARLREGGVWANDPVPLFPYPSSPDYRRLFGAPDERAWERAHAHYLARHATFSDIQEARPVPLSELERAMAGAA